MRSDAHVSLTARPSNLCASPVVASHGGQRDLDKRAPETTLTVAIKNRRKRVPSRFDVSSWVVATVGADRELRGNWICISYASHMFACDY